MFKGLLRRSFVALLVWTLIVQLGGWFIEARHCGRIGCADGTDDLGLGLVMFIFSVTSLAVVAIGLVLYQLLMPRRS
ncbi:hypothetical protein NYO99_13160 [Pelomonas sp. UHG3]|uniref:Uncharacterized protein n=1 Tax=Roseateles hydrophilus TaxID=2975054 RepID=A0ACC6CBV0_9BURK|nr:hypothetical protein [Pelomonas sp. UHG3]MCY4745927.1 hypothetical protein [Pelomonas sp. UHG3]